MRTKRKTVLLVDNNGSFLEAMTNLFVSHDYDVLACQQGESESVLNLIQKTRTIPDVALVDYSMPDCNGNQVACELSAKYANMPVYIVTGHGATRVKTKFPVIQKPFKTKQLFALLSEKTKAA